MTSVQRRYPKEEFARRGDVLYESDVRPNLKPEDEGRFVAIDIETGAFEIAEDELAACDRLRNRVPDAQIWLVLAGSSYLHTFRRARTARKVMIAGVVRAREARIRLRVRGPRRQEQEIDAVYELKVEVRSRGKVTIKRLPPLRRR